MKSRFKIILIVLLIAATALTIGCIAFLHFFGPITGLSFVNASVPGASAPDDDGACRLVLPDGDVVLQVGQSRQCSAELGDGIPAEDVFWSSGDESVARVDGGGRVTAVSPGETELLAVRGRECKARMKVTVFEDVRAAAVEAVNSLAADGSELSMNRVDSIYLGLSHAGDAESSRIAALLKAVSDFKSAGAEGNDSAPRLWDALVSAADASETGLDEDVLRQAALAAYSHGEKESSDVTITFTGDCTFGYYNEMNTAGRFPYVYEHSGSVTYPFDLTRQVFGADDITMINFEGTLTESQIHKHKKFYFRGKPSYAEILPKSSVEAVTVENNHSFDYFDVGYNDTIDYLKNAGVIYTSRDRPAVIDVRDYCVVMLSLCLFETDFSEEFLEQIAGYVNQYKNSSTVIIMNIHWGIEMDDYPQQSQVEAAHAMIDAGVDLIVGNHPHVPQGIELYNGHYIFYSLGNFSFGGNAKAKKPDTFMLRAMFGRDGDGKAVLKRFSVIPCLTTSSGRTMNNYRPTPLYGESGQRLIDRLVALSSPIDGGVDSLTWNMIP